MIAQVVEAVTTGKSEPFLTISILASSGHTKSLHGDIDFKTSPAHAYEDVADSIKMKATR